MITRLILLLCFLSNSFGSEILKEKLKRIQLKNNVPGLAAAIIRDGIILDIEAVGIKKSGFKTKLSINDKFHLGSNTKSMTATLAAILIEKNFLSWDSKLLDLLPEYKLHKDFQDITFELLLSHRSGLHKDIDGMIDKEALNLFSVLSDGTLSAKKDRELVTKFILKQAPRFNAKIDHNYSNLGYIIAGHILERLTKSTWEKLIQTYLFNPLHMKSCGFGETSDASNTTPLNTWGHKLFNKKFYSIHGDNPKYFAPAGNIHCNLSDWSKYLRIHLKALKGEVKILTIKSFKKLHTLYPAPLAEYTFGGWAKISQNWTNGIALVHSGTNTYNFARVWVLPGHNSILITASNISKLEGSKATNDAVIALWKLYLDN